MQSIKLLHIGDIHYPDRNEESGVDWKDKGLTGVVVKPLTPNPFKNVADEIREQLLNDPDIKGVLVSGDLTSRGNIDGYKDCVEFLTRVLDIGSTAVWTDKVLAVVPGNHDIPRSDVDLSGVDLFKKFSRTAEIWDAVLPGAFSPKAVKEADISVAGREVAKLVSLNTCIGCGEKRYLTAEVREGLHDVLERFAATADDLKRFELMGELLDTPAILEEHVGELERGIKDMQHPGVAIVLGHHALLPQARVRVDLYTELLNGGRFRSALATLDRNVLYCHGHLHEDPIEVVTHPAYPAGRLLVLSAPLFRHGFNVIELFFEGEGHPVGCAVHLYRIEPFGSVRKKSTVRVPLQSPANRGSLCDDVCLQILSELQGAPLRFGDLQKKTAIGREELTKRLQFLEWSSLIDIRNSADEVVHWNIARIGP